MEQQVHGNEVEPIKSGPSTMMVVAIAVMMTCRLGPAVSLNGSPTVSPVTAALCAALPLPEHDSGTRRKRCQCSINSPPW